MVKSGIVKSEARRSDTPCALLANTRSNLVSAYTNSTTQPAPCFVYFIASGDSAIKIGISDNPLDRLPTLQTSHFRKLSLLFTIECATKAYAIRLESAFHKRYKDCALSGEWFEIPEKRLSADIEFAQLIGEYSGVIRAYGLSPSAPIDMDKVTGVAKQALAWLLQHPEENIIHPEQLVDKLSAEGVNITRTACQRAIRMHKRGTIES